MRFQKMLFQALSVAHLHICPPIKKINKIIEINAVSASTKYIRQWSNLPCSLLVLAFFYLVLNGSPKNCNMALTLSCFA